MIRWAFIFVLIGLVVTAAVWFAGNPGRVAIEIAGLRIQTEAGIFILGLVLLAIVAALGYRLWRFVRYVPGGILDHRRSSRRQRGYQALTQGMVAVAAGDAGEARKFARQADALLNDPPLTMLLSAQSAQLNGDEAAAKAYFTAMLDRQETAFLGLRGLLMQAQREGNGAEELRLARRAYALRPKTPWVLTMLFDAQVRHDQWREALPVLEEAMRRGAMEGAEARRRRAVVLLGCSGEAEEAGDRASALTYAKRAASLMPDFLPATLRHIALMVDGGKKRAAARMLHNAWARIPHPELARIYAAMEESDDPLKKVRRFERLLSHNPDHAESHIALAEALLEARIWGAARSHLQSAAGDAPPARVCRLMAELEEAEKGDMAASRQWLLRAASAEPDSAWICSGCGAATTAWTPRCGRCNALGTLEWRPPDRARGLVLRAPAGSLRSVLAAAGGPIDAADADDDADDGDGARDDDAPGPVPPLPSRYQG
jgi:HemY protein